MKDNYHEVMSLHRYGYPFTLFGSVFCFFPLLAIPRSFFDGTLYVAHITIQSGFHEVELKLNQDGDIN